MPSKHGNDTRLCIRLAFLKGSHKADKQNTDVLIAVVMWMDAGHSLGGAMAVLAAYDIADLHQWGSLQVYTVGAPRPGNASFAAQYNAKVPHTWHIINPQVGPSDQTVLVTVVTGVNMTNRIRFSWGFTQTQLNYPPPPPPNLT